MEAAAEQKYSFEVVRWFTVMSVVYLVVGALVGVYIASELAWPVLNLDSPYLSFGRLRPLHTNAVIFAFGGCVLMALGGLLAISDRRYRLRVAKNVQGHAA